MAREVSSKNQITEGVIWKQLLLFFFPILFGTFFQQLYNTVDAIVVGRFVGKEALAAVGGPAATLINLLIGFFTGLASGATVIISQYYGAHKDGDVSKSVHTAAALSLVGGAVITVLGLLFCEPALRMMNTPEDVLGPSVTYMRIYFIGVIPSLIYNIGSGILRAIGDSRRPLYFLIAACLSNTVLDLVFVLVIPLGIAGVAIATTLAQFISAGLVLVVLMRTKESYQLRVREIRFNPFLLRNIVRIGLPAGLTSSMYSISNLLVQSSVNSFGTDTIAAWTAHGKVDGIFWMINGAYGVAITTFVGQNFGAGKIERVKKSTWICQGMAAATSVVLSVLLLFGGRFFFGIFTPDPMVVDIGMRVMWVIAPSYIFFTVIEILGGAARGCGDAVMPMLMTGIGVCVLRVLWVTLAVPIWPDIATVAFSYPLTWVVTSVLFIVYYLRGNWLKRCMRM